MFNINSLSHCDIASLLPHDSPMIFIDKVVEYEENTIRCELTVTPQSPYYDDSLQGVPNYVGIEYMAQTIATLAGITAKLNNDDIRIGFLLGSRKIDLSIPSYQVGQQYQICATKLYQEESGLAVFECCIQHQKKTIATANINVFQPQHVQDFIEQHSTSHPKNNKQEQLK